MADQRPQKLVLDIETGEQTLVPLEDEELAEYEARQAEAEGAASDG
jgi:hypothetical protein